jgi:hypothetical protein
MTHRVKMVFTKAPVKYKGVVATPCATLHGVLKEMYLPS